MKILSFIKYNILKEFHENKSYIHIKDLMYQKKKSRIKTKNFI